MPYPFVKLCNLQQNQIWQNESTPVSLESSIVGEMKPFNENREIAYVSKDITATRTWMKHILRGAKQNQTK